MTSQVVIGRDPGCDVVIAVPAVSSQHARLSWHGGQLVLEDLGSANGTYVNGERVSRVAVKPGTDVRLAEAPLPWGDPRIAALVRLGSSRSTIVAMPRFGPLPFRRHRPSPRPPSPRRPSSRATRTS